MKTLEQLLKIKAKLRNGSEFTPDFRISVQQETDDGVKVMIHPSGVRDNVLNFIIKDNEVKPV